MVKIQIPATKRLADIVLALVLIFPSLLFIGFLSLLTITINRFSPFFTCKRVGKNGKIFTCYKLQCLKPPTLETVLDDPQADRERMTKLGGIYRDHGWDELPQLLNILKGDMSFIGPRPVRQKVYDDLLTNFPNKKKLINDWINKRLQYFPGVSGWHQIHLNDNNVIKYDFDYFQNWTLAKSLKVIVISTRIFIVGKSHYFSPPIPLESYKHQI